jgi:hypothetical protein
MTMAKKMKNKPGSTSKANGASPGTLQPPNGAIIRGRHKEQLPCRVEGDAVELAGKELAKCVREQEELDEERREVLAGFREKQAGIKERAKAHATTVEMHTIARPVWCTKYLLRTNDIQIVREDTGEVVVTRAATPEELQQELPEPKSKKKARANGTAPLDFPDAPSVEEIAKAGGDLGKLPDQGEEASAPQ